MVTTWRNPETSFHGWKEEIVDGIHIHWYSSSYSNSFGFIRRLISFIKFAWAARSRSMAIGGEIVFATSTPLTIAIPGVYAAKKLSSPLVFEVRDLWPELPIAIGAIKNPALKYLAKRLELFAYRNSAEIVALSPGMAAGIAKTGYPENRITVIPNSCNTSQFSKRHETDLVFEKFPFLQNKKIILYAGSLGKMNGVGYLARIAAAVKNIDESVGFLIIGDGAEKQSILDLAKALGVFDENFWMLDRVSKELISSFFAASAMGCSLFIDLPEMQCNSANKFFDTLAAGKPALINYSGWHAKLLTENQAGLVLPPNNIEEAAYELVEFLKNDKLLHKASEEAAILATNQFNTELLYQEFKNVLIRASHT